MISNEKLSYFASNFWDKAKSKFALKDNVYTKTEVDAKENESLSKLKELAITLTGQENVQGETIPEVIDFINSNYGNYIIYAYTGSGQTYARAYKDEAHTKIFSKEELISAFKSGALVKYVGDDSLHRTANLVFNALNGGDASCVTIENGNTFYYVVSDNFLYDKK